jgi:hypothetical protein
MRDTACFGTRMGTNFLELGNKLPLALSELCVNLLYIENKITTSQSLYNFKFISVLH